MKVALLNDSFPPTVDGVANAVVNYADVLHRRGVDCFVATPRYPNVVDEYDFPVIRYRSNNLSKSVGYRAGEPFSPKLIRQFESLQPELLHTHCPVVSAILGRMVRDRLRVPLILTYHTKFDIDIRNSVKGKFLQDTALKAILNNIEACDEVWTVSKGAGENLKSLGYSGEYRVMENGVDFPKGVASPAETAALSDEYALPQNVPLFLYVGRLMWYKGIRLSLDGLKQAKERGLDFRFLIVGDGLDRSSIEDYIRQIGLADKCVFTGMIRDREKLRAIFSRANLFLFPSSFDTNGIVVREAAACDCPSLLLRGSCAAEGITHERNGLLIDEKVEDMTDRIVWACGHLGELAQIGRTAAREIYLSWDDAVARAQQRYEEILRDFNKDPDLWRAEHKRDLLTVTGSALSGLARMGRWFTFQRATEPDDE